MIALSEVIRRDGYSYSNEMTCSIRHPVFQNSTVSNLFVCFTHCRLGCVYKWTVINDRVPLLFKAVVGLNTHTHSFSLELIVLMWSMNPFSELIKHYRPWNMYSKKMFVISMRGKRNACLISYLSCLIPLYFIPLSDNLWTLLGENTWKNTNEVHYIYTHIEPF